MLAMINERIQSTIAEKSSHLDLSGLDFSEVEDSYAVDSEIIALIQSLPPHIKSLSLASCELGKLEGGDELLSEVPKHIVELDLRDNIIFADRLEHLHPRIKRLNVANNFLIDEQNIDDGRAQDKFETEARILIGCLPKKLEYLDLSNNIVDPVLDYYNRSATNFSKLTLNNVKTILRVIFDHVAAKERLLYLKTIQFAENDVRRIEEFRNDDELQDLILNINPHLILKIGSVELRLEKAHFSRFIYYSVYSVIFDEAGSKDVEDMLKTLPTSVRSIVFSCESDLKPQDEDLQKVFRNYFRNNPNCVIYFQGARYTIDGPAIRTLVEGQYPTFIKVIGTEFHNPSSKNLYESRTKRLNQVKPAAAQEVISSDEHRYVSESKRNSAGV